MNNLRTGCVFFIAAFSLGFGQRVPSITYISEPQEADVGGTVELTCSVQYATEYSVNWLKTGKNRNDQVFISTGTSLVLKESRFALLYDGASATFTVLIKDLQESDAGTYQCEVVLSVNNKISAESILLVREPPVITDNSTQAIVTTEGESVKMECYASGYPPPKIVWRRENNALLPTGKFKSSTLRSIISLQNIKLSSRFSFRQILLSRFRSLKQLRVRFSLADSIDEYGKVFASNLFLAKNFETTDRGHPRNLFIESPQPAQAKQLCRLKLFTLTEVKWSEECACIRMCDNV